MHRRLILDSKLLEITVDRLCQQLMEYHESLSESVFIALQPRGVSFSNFLLERLANFIDYKVPVGYLDTTFYRDDFRRRDDPIKANETQIDFIIEDKNVILLDDVLFTGRSVRAALDAMLAYGRPSKVELLVLIDRKYSRDLPIEPDYVGKSVNTMEHQRVSVGWVENGEKENNVWLIDNN